VAEETTAPVLSNEDWLLERLNDDGPTIVISAERRADDHDDAEESCPPPDDDGSPAALEQAPQPDPDTNGLGERPHDLDEPATSSAGEAAGADVNAGARRTALWLGSGVVVVAVLIVLAFMVFGGGPDPTPVPQHRATTPAVVAAPTTASLPVPQQDQAVPFTPSTDSCSAGSTSALALTDTSTDSAWVCARGPQESFLDGQVLHVRFTCDSSRPESTCSYMLNSVSVTPGWLAKTPGGKDEWLQHRVVTMLQFNFFNGDQLAADPFYLPTNSVHGPVTATLPTKVLASRVDVLILHTDRPPAAPLPTASAPAAAADGAQQPPDGLLDSVLGTVTPDAPPMPPTDPASDTNRDPVDATFAMSQLQFFGHAPN
jgi:hypothetical protein